MDLDTVDDDTLDQLADRLAERLDPGAYGDRVVLSRRQLVGVATGVLGTGTLLSLGVDPAAAQAAGSVGTSSDPVDVNAYDLDVQNGVAMNGTDITGAGSVSVDRLTAAGSVRTAANDSELDNVLSNSIDGDKIILGNATFTDNRTISTEVTIVGSALRFNGTFIDGDWDFTSQVKIKNINLTNGSLTLSYPRSHAYHIDRANVTADANRCLIVGINGGSVNVTSNSSATLLDVLNDVSITDNGSGTVIGTTD